MAANEIAAAYVSILPSMRGFRSSVTRELSGLDSEGVKAGKSMGGGIASGLKSAAGLVTGAVAAIGIGAFVAEAAKASDATDKFKATLNFAGVDTSGIEAAKKAAKEYADQTVYDLPTIQNMLAQLASNGVKDYTGLTKAAGNLNAVAGGNADTFKSVAMVMTQTAGAGKLTTENWNQLADAIPGAAGPLMKSLEDAGAYTGNFRDAMAKGQITSEEFNAALMELGTKPVAVEAAKSTATFEGAIGNLQATINSGLMVALDAIKPAATGAITALSNGLGKAFEWTGQAAQGLYDVFAKNDFSQTLASAFHVEEDAKLVAFLFDARQAALDLWAGLTMGADLRAEFAGQISGLVAFGAKIRETFDTIAAIVGPTLSTIGQAFAPMLPQIVELVTALSPLHLLFTALLPVLPQVAGLLQTVGETLSGALASVLPTLTSLVQTFVGILSSVFLAVMPIVVSLVQAAGEVFAKLVPVIVNILNAVMPLVASLATSLVPVITNLVSTVLPPVIDLFMQVVDAILPLVDMILAILVPAIQFLMPIVTFAFQVIANVIKVAIGIAVGIISGLVGFIKDVLVPVVMWLWRNIIQPAFNAIGAVISWVWNNVIQPAFAAIQWYINNILAPVITWLWNTIIKPAFDGIGATIKWVWENVIKPVFDFLADAIQNKIPDAFEKGKKFVEDIWKGIQDVVKAPIKFVVETVLNNGLIGAFNSVADFLKIGRIQPIALPQGFAEGGYTGNGGKYQPAGIVHAGEFVFTKEQTARAGVGNLYALARSLMGYAQGGFVDPLRGGLMVTQGYNRVHKGIDYAAGVGTPVFAANTGRVSWAGPGVQAPGVWGGNEVHILGDGIETWYAHLSSIGVKLGEMVRAGQQIALSGNTGISSGPHLHFGVFSGGWPNDLDPGGFLSGAQADGKGFNPIAGIIDGLIGQFKAAFPQGGFVIDLVGDFAKNLLSMASDAVMNLIGGNTDKKGSAAGLLFDGGGWLEQTAGPMLVQHKKSKPDAVLTNDQWSMMRAIAANSQAGGAAVQIGEVHTVDVDEFVRKVRNEQRDALALIPGMVVA